MDLTFLKNAKVLEVNLGLKPTIVSIPADIAIAHYGWTEPLADNNGNPINGGKGTLATTETRFKAGVKIATKRNQLQGEPAPTVKPANDVSRVIQLLNSQINSTVVSGSIPYSSIRWWPREWADRELKYSTTTVDGGIRVGGKDKGVLPNDWNALWACVRLNTDNKKEIFCVALKNQSLSFWIRPYLGDGNVVWTQLGSAYDLANKLNQTQITNLKEGGHAYRCVRMVALNGSRNLASIWCWTYMNTREDFTLDVNLDTGAYTAVDVPTPMRATSTVVGGGVTTETATINGNFGYFLEYSGDTKLWTHIEIAHSYQKVTTRTADDVPTPAVAGTYVSSEDTETTESYTYTLVRGAYSRSLSTGNTSASSGLDQTLVMQDDPGIPGEQIIQWTLDSSYTSSSTAAEADAICWYLGGWGQLNLLNQRGTRTRTISATASYSYQAVTGQPATVTRNGSTNFAVTTQLNTALFIPKGGTPIELGSFTNPAGSEVYTWTEGAGDFDGLDQYNEWDTTGSSSTSGSAKLTWAQLLNYIGEQGVIADNVLLEQPHIPCFRPPGNIENTEWVNERSIGEFSLLSLFKLKTAFRSNEYGGSAQNQFVPDNTKTYTWCSHPDHLTKYAISGETQMLKNLHIV